MLQKQEEPAELQKIERLLTKLDREDPQSNPSVYVHKFVDYSSKFGVGYLLSNKTCGVHFNDGATAVARHKSELLKVIYKNGDSNQYDLL